MRKIKVFISILGCLLLLKGSAQHNVELYANFSPWTNSLVAGGGNSLFLGVESLYNYDFGKDKLYIGVGCGLGFNYIAHDNIVQLVDERGSTYRIPKNPWVEIPFIANFTLGNNFIRFYTNGSFSPVLHSKVGNDVQKNAGVNFYTDIVGFESGLKFLIPTKHNMVFLFGGYKFNSAVVNSNRNEVYIPSEQNSPPRMGYNSYKVGFGINFGEVFKKKATKTTTE